jgi:co-chaperonin GroES (HSP10)
MKIKPYPGYVLLSEEENKDVKLKSGIEIEHEEDNKSTIGKVVEVPEQLYDRDYDFHALLSQRMITYDDMKELAKFINIGHRIIFKKYSGHEVEYEDKKYFLVVL